MLNSYSSTAPKAAGCTLLQQAAHRGMQTPQKSTVVTAHRSGTEQGGYTLLQQAAHTEDCRFHRNQQPSLHTEAVLDSVAVFSCNRQHTQRTADSTEINSRHCTQKQYWTAWLYSPATGGTHRGMRIPQKSSHHYITALKLRRNY